MSNILNRVCSLQAIVLYLVIIVFESGKTATCTRALRIPAASRKILAVESLFLMRVECSGRGV